MNRNTPFESSLSAPIETLIQALDSLTDGALAVDLLVACGKRAVGPLEEFLLHGRPRTIAIPRRRAVQALGALEARDVLLAYFERVGAPRDPAVLFAEDAVRSEVAHELMLWRDEETFQVLLGAARQRATFGLIEALGEFRRPEAVPVFFEGLEDDLCSAAALTALLNTPGEAREYAILSLRRETETNLEGAGAARRRRGVAKLLHKLKIARSDWQDISRFLQDDDPAVVICTASLGFCTAPESEFSAMVQALFGIASKLNWLQEDEMVHLLDEHKQLAHSEANRVLADLRAHGEHANWLSPKWRILAHLNPADFTRSEL